MDSQFHGEGDAQCHRVQILPRTFPLHYSASYPNTTPLSDPLKDVVKVVGSLGRCGNVAGSERWVVMIWLVLPSSGEVGDNYDEVYFACIR